MTHRHWQTISRAGAAIAAAGQLVMWFGVGQAVSTTAAPGVRTITRDVAPRVVTVHHRVVVRVPVRGRVVRRDGPTLVVYVPRTVAYTPPPHRRRVVVPGQIVRVRQHPVAGDGLTSLIVPPPAVTVTLPGSTVVSTVTVPASTVTVTEASTVTVPTTVTVTLSVPVEG